GVRQVLPRARHAGHRRLAAERAFGSDLAGHPRDFRGEAVELVHHRIDGLLELQDLALHVHGDLAHEVASGDGGGHGRNPPHLAVPSASDPPASTGSDSSSQVPPAPAPPAWPPRRPSVPTSRATRVTSDAKDRSWSTMLLMASLSWRISPRTSTVIFLDRSPL